MEKKGHKAVGHGVHRLHINYTGVVFFTFIAISVPQQLASLYLQNVHHISIQQIGTMGTITSIGTAIIMFSLGNLRVSTGMLIGQLLLAGFALLMWQGQSVKAYYAGYFFVGGYHLYRSMALAFRARWSKSGIPGWHMDSLRRGTPWQLSLLHLQRDSCTIIDQKRYIASLVALAITVGLNMLLFHEKRNQILPAQT